MNRSHGLPRSPTYLSWQAAKARCYDQSQAAYPDYGGRGITVCDRWRDSFEAFLADMGERPAGKTLDRRDPDGDYEPGNCRWATPEEQAQTKRTSELHEWRGRLLNTKQIADLEAVPYTSLRKKVRTLGSMGAALLHVRARLGRSGAQNLHPTA